MRLNVVPKFMIGGNAITNTSSTRAAERHARHVRRDGCARVSVHSTLGVFSWLGSVDTGVAWDVTDRWSLSMGYRVVGVGNIAQADGQWPTVITSPGRSRGSPPVRARSCTVALRGFEGRY